MKMLLCAAALVLAGGAGWTGERGEDAADRYKPGDWALYRMMGLDSLRMLQTIVSVEGEGDDAVVTISAEIQKDGRPGKNPTEMKRTIGQLRAEDERTRSRVSRQETVRIGEREVVADVIEERKNGKIVTMMGSNSLPVTGVIRVQEQGQPPSSELIDFGWGAAGAE